MKSKPKGPKYRNLYAWRGSIWYERVAGGRRYKVNTKAIPDTTEGWREAAQFRDLYEERKGVGSHRQTGQVPRFSELVESYFESRKFQQLAHTTQEDRRSHLSQCGAVLPMLGSKRVDDITPDTLIDWWERVGRERGWSLETGFRYISTITEVLKLGRRYLNGRPLPTTEARDRMAEERRTAAGRAASSGHIHPIEDPEAIGRLLDSAQGEGLEVAAFVVALIDSGIRRGEARALRWGQIAWGLDEDDTRRHILIDRSRSRAATTDGHTKSGHNRAVGLSRRLRAALGDLYLSTEPRPAPDDLVFPSMDLGTLRKVWRRVTQQADLPGVCVKDCRDTYASHLLTAGFPIQWVSKQLGHSSIAITEARYAKYLGKAGSDHIYVEPARIEAGEIPTDVLARLHDSPQSPHKGDPFEVPGFLQACEDTAESDVEAIRKSLDSLGGSIRSAVFPTTSRAS